METSPFRILIVDDNPAIHRDFAKIFLPPAETVADLDASEVALFGTAPQPRPLQAQQYELHSAHQGEQAVEMVRLAMQEQRPYAMTFVDMRMPPGMDGLQTLLALWQLDPHLQAVICTAYSDYSWEQMCEQLGVTDNLLILKKPFDVAEVQQMASSLTRKWHLAQQARVRLDSMERAVEQRTLAMRESHQQFALTFHAAPLPQALFRFDDGACMDANTAFCQLTGAAPEQWKACPLQLLAETQLLDVMSSRHPVQAREVVIRCGGAVRRVAAYTQAMQFGSSQCILLMVLDISERLRLEEQLRHAQKMEAVGQLAAGVAHEFNNILTVIQGNLSLLQSALPDAANGMAQGFDAEALHQTLDAAKRAAALTRQLLMFSRKQVFQPAALDLNDLLKRQSRLLARLLGEHVEVSTELAEGLPPTHGDSLSLEQVLTNLAINARDAMPQGGRLIFRTTCVEVTAEALPPGVQAAPGRYVCVSVIDNGTGMDEATLSRIFEPFFTTKGIGHGTGMGLAMTYATIQQHRGWLSVRSSVGQGTCFDIYLPVSHEPVPAREDDSTVSPPTAPVPVRVLLVEDDPAVRKVMRQMLARQGCSVIEGETAAEGYTLWMQHRAQIDLIITDLIMPGGHSGEDMVREVLKHDPNVNVIYCSGYSPSLFENGSGLVNRDNFLPKPYDAENVNRVLRRVASLRNGGTGKTMPLTRNKLALLS